MAAGFLIVALFAPGGAHAIPCPPTQLCGTVVTSDGAPVELAEVAFTAGDTRRDALTGPDGAFVLDRPDGAAAGHFSIHVMGYAPLESSHADAERAGFRFVLRAQHAAADDIVVTVKRLSSGFAPLALSKLELLTDPQARSDPLLAVANLPGSTNIDNSADLQLRGSDAGLSRVYFNDVPLYEVVRGSAVDRVTRGASVFNPSVVRDVEVYPTSPPAYLANSAAGAARILPDDSASGVSTLFAGTTGASLTRAGDLGRGGFVQGYASYTNLAPLLALNPNQKAVTTRFEAGALGAAWQLRLPDAGRATLLTVLDAERGRYPLRLLNLAAPSTSARTRLYLLGSVEQPIGSVRIKTDLALTRVWSRFGYARFASTGDNHYVYAGTDLAGSAGAAIRYRIGAAAERFVLDTDGTPGFAPGAAASRVATRSTAGYGAAYGYVTLAPADTLSLALGTRQFLAGTPQRASYSVAATFRSRDKRHRLILGGGTYSALVPFELGAAQPIAAAHSRQLALDYRFEGRDVQFALGGYAKRDTLAGVATRVHGLDASLSAAPVAGMSFKADFTLARPRSQGHRGANDIAYLVRLASKVALGGTATANLAFVQRSGAVFTEVTGARSDGGGGFAPIYAPTINAARLGAYRTLDVNLVDTLRVWPGARKPIAFVAVTNVLDRRNPARAVYSADFAARDFAYYERRAVSFGLVFAL